MSGPKDLEPTRTGEPPTLEELGRRIPGQIAEINELNASELNGASLQATVVANPKGVGQGIGLVVTVARPSHRGKPPTEKTATYVYEPAFESPSEFQLSVRSTTEPARYHLVSFLVPPGAMAYRLAEEALNKSLERHPLTVPTPRQETPTLSARGDVVPRWKATLAAFRRRGV